MKSLKGLSLACVALLVFPHSLKADPITGGYPVSRAGSSQGTPAPNTFHFDSPASNPSLFPASASAKENQLLAVALDQAPPALPGSVAPVAPAGGAPRLLGEAAQENPLSASAIPAAANGAPAFRLDNSQPASPVTVEPSSLVLLGTGLICAAAVVLRRRRTV